MKSYLTIAVMAACILSACTSNSTPDTKQATTDNTPADSAIDKSKVLTDYVWQLQGPLVKGQESPLQLQFKDGRVGVSGGCNLMGGTYQLQQSKLMVGELTSTMRGCVPEVADLDASIGAFLNAGPAYAVTAANGGYELVLSNGSDKKTFKGLQTPEAKYGQAGETIFMEVSNELKPCHHPLMKDAQCMQVREVYYNDQGLKDKAPGDWTLFYDKIEGYTHNPNERNVVRVKRYKIDNPPADASAYAYVLDMVVEREAITP